MMYIGSTLASLWTIFFGSSYLWSIGLVLLQGTAVAFFMMQVFAGGEAASNQLKSMTTSSLPSIFTKGDQNV
jgi:hypothetical protein